ncbi:hypothetical protein [Flavobacterium reichenbachii]|uniref:Uncharacterized protein n=1 Tax=Flavobacterium reichenbachii TaxID=362418 RepID=A0A085ZN19_9FLAO|nr:hypothetical protein [Flavobacterium reichenbachii]KFF05833.1 hypothetical protein IW19_09995 [Flavobacterium reichenbachii]OXB12718.1 hypothetical protein B0A68_18190 [Flavobacterium reichenbachii]
MKELVDSRNQNLWNEINQNYTVEFEESINNEYGVYSINNSVTFVIDKNHLCIDSFTHEILHIYMNMKDLYFTSSLKLTLLQSKILSENISVELIEHIGNCLDHIKMLPIYLELGFDRNKFIADYDYYKCNSEEIREFNKSYRTGKKINLKAVDPFIGRLVAILCDPNEDFNYSSDLNKLKKIDPLLFKIIERLIDHTKEIKVINRNIYEDNHRTVIANFYKNLTYWISQNNFRS